MMKFFRKKYIIQFLYVILGGLSLLSCADDNLDPKTDNGLVFEEDGSYLTFQVDLLSLTREGGASFENYEDYIDRNNVKILFFYGSEYLLDSYGKPTNQKNPRYNTLFKQFDSSKSELSFIPIATANDPRVKNWYVRIPASDKEFVKIVKENDFKIAVLANWPAIPENNVLKEEKRNNLGEVINLGDNIQKLHHLSVDDTYHNGKDRQDTYGFLYGEGNTSAAMGLSTKWADHNLGFKKESEATSWIREEWKPGMGYGEIHKDSNPGGKYYTYKDLRLVWNFNGAIRYGLPSSDAAYDPNYELSQDYGSNADEWAKKNSEELSEWLLGGNSSAGLVDFEVLDEEGDPIDNGRFKFIGAKTNGEKASVVLNNGRYGIVLPPGNKDENVIKINLPASGHLSIDAEIYNPSNDADEENCELKIERRNHEEDGDYTKGVGTSGELKDWEIKISGNSEFLSIYCNPNDKGKGRMIIYSIEYIQDIYLYETDRKGIELSPDQLIPMYGVQTFDKLGNLWKEGTVFDLSNFNNLGPNPYPDPSASPGENENAGEGENEDEEEVVDMITPYYYKNIPLIRSVAKVVLKIPIAMEDHHHVYLRSMNRTARCEPMDVSTPTDEYWFDNGEDNVHDANCEWHHLIGHEPFYDPSSTPLTTYQQKLAWYYGSWAEDGWIDEVKVPDMDFGKVGSPKDGSYPQILNPMINRTDFAEFIYTGEVEQLYKRYVLYVPEKFVDDPNNVGKMDSSPKICHIEFRGGEDSWTNLDDDNCFRVYFTPGGHYGDYPTFKKTYPVKNSDGTPKIQNGKQVYDYDTWENSYEKDPDIIKKHWPIMRNHIYNMTVEDSNRRIVVLKLEVLPWKDVDVNNYNW